MGHHNVRFDGDPNALKGAWSPPTSRANFCEEDYALTRYLAEFVNALTNVVYICLALCHLYGPGSRGIFAPKWDFMSLALLLLGIGSFLFHASLRQVLEFVDELSMLVVAWSLLQALLVIDQAPARKRLISICLAAVFTSFSAFYIHSAKIIYQVIAFISALVVVGLRTHHLLHSSKPGFTEAQARAWRVRTWKATIICLVGYTLWNIDLEYCVELRAIRQRVGLPWAWLFELHGWWHILTAIGASRFMDVVREVRGAARRRAMAAGGSTDRKR